jgi:teichuronic acid biosynthesis glycosyltransferase TuaC
MKVLQITNNYPTKKFPIFGIFVKEQIDSLTDMCVDNDVFFINGRERGKLEYIKSIFRLRKLLKNKQYDVIHCHHALSAICLILSGRARRFRTVVSYQSNPFYEQGSNIYRFIKMNFNVVILKINIPIIDNKKVFYQPNGVNVNIFKPIDKYECFEKLNLNINKIYVLFVSSNFVREEKRYDRFNKVIEILKNKYHLSEIEELLLINVERSLVPYYFNASSLHLLTSDFEGSPNSVKEAMACNTPVVTTDVGNVKELLTEVDGSFVACTKNTEELAELAYKSLKFSGEINSREKLIHKQLDIESVAEKIISIYKK